MKRFEVVFIAVLMIDLMMAKDFAPYYHLKYPEPLCFNLTFRVALSEALLSGVFS